MDDFEYYFLQNEEESEHVKGAKVELHNVLKRNRERHSKVNKPMKAASNVISLLGGDDAPKGKMEEASHPGKGGEKTHRKGMQRSSARSREHCSKRRRTHKTDTKLKTEGEEEEEVPSEDPPVGDNSNEDHHHSEVNAECQSQPDDSVGEVVLEENRKGKRKLNENNITHHGKKAKGRKTKTSAIPTDLNNNDGKIPTVGEDDDKKDTSINWTATEGSAKSQSNSCSGTSDEDDQSASPSSGRSSSADCLSHDKDQNEGSRKMGSHTRGENGGRSVRLAPGVEDNTASATGANTGRAMSREKRVSGGSRQSRVSEEAKPEKKKYSGRMLLHKFKINYQSLTESEKKYYLYMMKKLRVHYDHERHIFYTDDVFTKCFTEKVRKEKEKFNYLGYLEYACFYILEWLTPTKEEKLLKHKSLLKLEVVVKSLFPKAKMEPFGSFVTGLSIPGSDLDVCFLNIPLEDLDALLLIAYALVKLDMVTDIRLIKDARVKILKYTDKETGVQVDVCTNQLSSRQTTDFIKSKMEKYIYLRPLVILLKFFLNTRNLNETYIGGIGSFMLCCMVLHFLQLHPTTFDWNVFNNSYLVKLLLEFFSFYSIDYKLDFNCSVLRGLGHVMPRYLRREYDINGRLCIENPIDISLDIGKNAYKIRYVFYLFSHQFCALTSLIGELRGKAGEALLSADGSERAINNKVEDNAVEKEDTYMEDKAEEQEENQLSHYAEGDKMNAAGYMYPLFFANFLNPDSIVFTKRFKANFPNPHWNISHFDFSITKEEKHKLLEMLREDITSSDFDEGVVPESTALFATFDKAFPFSLDLYNNAFRYA
ncbi:nucleotidyltransferase, putative [Plasmodium knowlesi strain H]|uniref:Nucleotidyltransferase, putative n=3 Tax=Plasmodium knowlesi TaxID=5850 RepID=A0A5K1U518_PLAKH|nr:nucleotidyltransferase, putative [Plasmodium knowlesi strain H]OTN66482.1 putative Nucleotidyltransferase [Plasmodium knowlesi]CAA9990000.1 nucleotidyltransferase, putative [Plasmodium knowlesi strain H]SBO24596.1 nucleotidyltransferase, putative [Plasmodium knowlesi strain H]SBO26253.1 nucleotidyltransferase, putative [Plasmodium knowlesi strain H]VVS79474.1 nucleotidyltransferase, putative [Plasmodium knowlesi strain H]|eukprot:XP_002260015.1 hypothetical protein, conserved in Plasmodium species [Plasmodium knowlesi strain H]